MEAQRLVQVRKFVRETLNLSDSARITEFSLKTEGGILRVAAMIEQEVDIEKLTNVGYAKVEENQQSRYKVKPKQERKRTVSRTGQYSIYREFEKNAKDFSDAKHVLRGLRKSNKLITPEVESMSSFAGEVFSLMSEERKQEFLDMMKAIRERLKGEQNVSNN